MKYKYAVKNFGFRLGTKVWCWYIIERVRIEIEIQKDKIKQST